MNTQDDIRQPAAPWSQRRVAGYHSHVYFDASTVEQARLLCQEAARRFGAKMGRVHEKPVGPHPDWSCQLAYRPQVLAELLPWLAMNRHGLVVFTHPVTGNDLIDHRDFAIWMGAIRPLDLSRLSGEERPVDNYEF
ncbi:dioxygenase [Pusillimonas caeni]|uniref:DOPA 4,5-dioxygenase family protein n=1 Tax=Pusillimonas caeni TaxID=1348472 RepID=UPI000E5A0016|nr:DOPA 4,5-dioxygenase family protein [Pusillimonas caeni]TFL11369.1 dioxygenase [Pusillimonas caeni]